MNNAERRAALVEKMNKAYWKRGPIWHPTPEERIAAALDVAMEEAARVAEIYEYDEIEDDGGAVIKPSAAIRALGEK